MKILKNIMNIIGINLTNKTKFDYVNMNDNNSETLILLKKIDCFLKILEYAL